MVDILESDSKARTKSRCLYIIKWYIGESEEPEVSLCWEDEGHEGKHNLHGDDINTAIARRRDLKRG